MSFLLRALAATALFFTLWFMWPRELDGFSTGRDGRLSVPDYAMTNARYVSVKEGRVEMESIARDTAYDLAERRMDAKDVTAYFYNVKNEKTQVKADRAIFLMDQRKVTLFDNVTSLSPDGFILRGAEAEYRMDTRFLTSPKPVEGEMPERNMRVWGDRAQGSLDEKRVELTGNARTQYVEKKRGITKVRGDSALMDREKQQITFRENVKVEQEKMVATSRTAQVFYAPEEKNVRYMSLLDDVKITESGGRYTRSQVAEFFAPTDTIVLSQFPSVYHGDDVVTGDRITLYRATGVVEVTATNAAGRAEKIEKPSRPQPLSKEDEELIP